MRHILSMFYLLLIISVSYSFADVELVSFTATFNSQRVTLRWTTATEVNNYGFNIERRDSGGISWDSVGFVAGFGTSNTPHEYTTIDSFLSSGLYYYRLKQIDNDGSYKYSLPVEIPTGVVTKNHVILGYELHLQNYPNPFNPSTRVEFTLKKQTSLSLKIYDYLGREIAILFSGTLSKGKHTFEWNANSFASGIYFSRLVGDNIDKTLKLILQR